MLYACRIIWKHTSSMRSWKTLLYLLQIIPKVPVFRHLKYCRIVSTFLPNTVVFFTDWERFFPETYENLHGSCQKQRFEVRVRSPTQENHRIFDFSIFGPWCTGITKSIFCLFLPCIEPADQDLNCNSLKLELQRRETIYNNNCQTQHGEVGNTTPKNTTPKNPTPKNPTPKNTTPKNTTPKQCTVHLISKPSQYPLFASNR